MMLERRKCSLWQGGHSLHESILVLEMMHHSLNTRITTLNTYAVVLAERLHGVFNELFLHG